MTAAEGMAILQSDPEWVRRHEEYEAAQKARVAQRNEEIEPEDAPLMADLVAARVKVCPSHVTLLLEPGTSPDPASVRSLSDLVNTPDNYPEAIPILYKHLRTAKHPDMVEWIARALTVKEACGPQAREILEKLQRLDFLESTPAVPRSDARWALANALTVVGDAGMVDEIKALIADPRHADIQARLKDALKHCERLAKRSSERSAPMKRNPMP